MVFNRGFWAFIMIDDRQIVFDQDRFYTGWLISQDTGKKRLKIYIHYTVKKIHYRKTQQYSRNAHTDSSRTFDLILENAIFEI